MHKEIKDFFPKIIQEIEEFLQNSSKRSKSFESSKLTYINSVPIIN